MMSNDNKARESGFSLSLAVVDVIPILLFLLMGSLAAKKIDSPLLLIASIICVLAGMMKVIWKILLAAGKGDRHLLPVLFRIFMPAGFALIIAALLRQSKKTAALIAGMSAFPSLIFLILGTAGMAAMLIFAFKIDRKNVRGNWLEEYTNIFMQGMFLICILLA